MATGTVKWFNMAKGFGFIAPDAPIADAIAIMNAKRITLLFAVEDGKPVGVVHMHDLLGAGVR